MDRFSALLVLYSSILFSNVHRGETIYLVSLTDRCVGAIIDEKFILTAASCVVNPDYSFASISKLEKVITGTFDVGFEQDPKRQEIDIERICIPKDYQPPRYGRHLKDADLAIVKLKENLNLTEDRLEKLQLQIKNIKDAYAGEYAAVSGFRGTLFQGKYNYKYPNGKYYYSTVKIMKNEDCDERYRSIDWCNVCSEITSDMTWLNTVKPYGACNYGAPLVGRKNELIGLAISVRCDETKDPTVYTNVAHYLEIIKNAMKDVVTDRKIMCRSFKE